MKDLRDYLVENQASLTGYMSEQLNEGKATETVVKDKEGNDVTIIGKPFTTDRDERYIMAKEYIKKNNLKIDIDLKDAIEANGENADEIEAWVFVKAPKSVHVVDADLLDIPENMFEGKKVYAVIDFTGAIQGVFDDEDAAKKAIDEMPKEAEAKVQAMKKSEIEKD